MKRYQRNIRRTVKQLSHCLFMTRIALDTPTIVLLKVIKFDKKGTIWLLCDKKSKTHKDLLIDSTAMALFCNTGKSKVMKIKGTCNPINDEEMLIKFIPRKSVFRKKPITFKDQILLKLEIEEVNFWDKIKQRFINVLE